MLLEMDNMLPAVLRDMQESEFEFALTGSRFFEDPNPNDWDFYVHDAHGLRALLERWGFEKEFVQNSDYLGDSNVAEVWRFDATLTHPQVHVQIVHDFEARRVIAHTFKECLIEVYSTSQRTTRAMIWRALFRAYGAGMTRTRN